MPFFNPSSPSEQYASDLRRELRLLFLDDDPARAQIFLADNPAAIWVQTVVECLEQLERNWDEVHLDHDLGGERYVDLGREDCGMEVVRWLCLEPRPHLIATRFFIHSHNANAAAIMVAQMRVAGYRVEFRPFGVPHPPSSHSGASRSEGWPPPSRGWLGWLRRFLGRSSGSMPGAD